MICIKKRILISLFILLLIFIFLWSCKRTDKTNIKEEIYFKTLDSPTVSKLYIQYAKGFNIHYIPEGKLLYLFNNNDTSTYLLLTKGKQISSKYSNLPFIQIPVQKLVVLSSTHLGLIDFLDSYDCLAAVPNINYIYNERIIEAIQKEKIMKVGNEYNLNVEKILALHPDLVMFIGYPGSPTTPFQIIKDAGITILPNTEWQETTLLGRAEWVKILAALVNKDSLAQIKFNKIVERYNKLLNKVSNVKERPKLISGIPYKGSWGVPAGRSYMAKVFAEAGGDYFRKENRSTGVLQLDFEAVYYAGLTADIWFNPGNVKNKQDLLSMDKRFADLKPFKENQIYNNNKRINKAGGNDYYESALVNPDLHLADLIKIIHPNLLPDHQLIYYQRIGN